MDLTEEAKRISEVSATFTMLNIENQEYVLGILRALLFAETINNHNHAQWNSVEVQEE